MRRNWMPLYIADFLADTVQLSAAETGAYLLLIFDYWLHDGLPDDDAKLAQIARVPIKSWRQMRPTIEAFFRPGWRHKRIDAELLKMVGMTERRRAAGSKGGTVSSIMRSNASSNASSKRAANVQQTPQQNPSKGPSKTAAIVQHSTQERILNTSVGTARASETGEKPPENPANEPGSMALPAVATPQGFAMEARKAVQQASSSIGSGELASVIQAKRWVP